MGYYLANSFFSKVPDLEKNVQVKFTDCRDKYTCYLGKALSSIRLGDFEKARDLFSRAELYHISDYRAYIYKAVLDVVDGDDLSALKLIIYANSVVDWSNKKARETSTSQFVRILSETDAPGLKPKEISEIKLLKSLLKMYRNEGKNETDRNEFLKTYSAYASDHSPDLLWAGLVYDAALKLFRKDGYQSQATSFLMELGMILPSVAFMRLRHLGEDLSEFDDVIVPNEDNTLSFSFRILVSSSEFKKQPISISKEDFEIDPVIYKQLLKEILRERYQDLCLLLIRIGGQLPDFLKILTQMSHGTEMLNTPFLCTLIDRITSEGNQTQKIELLNWAANHLHRWPKALYNLLTNSALKWVLDLPIQTKQIGEKLSQAKDDWLEATQTDLTLTNSTLAVAFKAWCAIREKQYKKAESIVAPFFKNREDHVSGDTDLVALRMLGTAQAFLKNKSLAQSMPQYASSETHSEMIRCAFIMIAREGMIKPYVVPNLILPKREARELCRLYVGQRRQETERKFIKRLKKERPGTLSDFRKVKQTHLYDDVDNSQKDWVFPVIKPNSIKQMTELVEEEIAYQDAQTNVNNRIAKDTCEYSQDLAFIKLVQEDPIFSKKLDPTKIFGDKAFLILPQKVKDHFQEELREKIHHQEALNELKNKAPAPEKKPEKRFWQIVEQISALIDIIKTSSRNENRYDIWASNEEEARLIMRLIAEWSRISWTEMTPELAADYFHGPETHVWGKGPRFPHFNAGVYLPGESKPKNVHIFFG